MKIDHAHGTWTLVSWKWFVIRGTTPANADVWTLDVELGLSGPGVWLSTGKHRSIMVWYTGTKARQWRRTPKPGTCDCYECTIIRWKP